MEYLVAVTFHYCLWKQSAGLGVWFYRPVAMEVIRTAEFNDLENISAAINELCLIKLTGQVLKMACAKCFANIYTFTNVDTDLN